MQEVAERAKRIIADRLGIPLSDVRDDAGLVQDLDADSLDKIQLCMAIEEEFGCHIPDEVIETIITVGDVVRVLERMAAPQRQTGPIGSAPREPAN